MPASDLSGAMPAGTAPNHHIPAEFLLDYAAGSLPLPWSLVVASHLTLCPHCRTELAGIERIGGSLVERSAPRPMRAGFDAIADRLGAQAPAEAPLEDTPGAALLPAPLRAWLPGNKGGDLDRIPWRWSGKGLQSCALPVPRPRGGMISLLRVAPGAGLPLHTHGGEEMTLVLSGGFTDEQGEFRRGDVEFADGGVDHRPVAMLDGPCICLAVTDAPLRFHGRLGWLLSQWARLSG
jgi:putative transcriptional regulator